MAAMVLAVATARRRRRWLWEPLRKTSTRGTIDTMSRGDNCDMENEDWQIVESLVDGKRCLAAAWRVLDGTDGAAPGVEHALGAALSSIDAMYAIDHVNAYKADVASPIEVQEFWEKHGELPGFAIGT